MHTKLKKETGSMQRHGAKFGHLEYPFHSDTMSLGNGKTRQLTGDICALTAHFLSKLIFRLFFFMLSSGLWLFCFLLSSSGFILVLFNEFNDVFLCPTTVVL